MGGDGEEDKNYEQNTNPLTVPSTWSKSILFLLQLICKPRYFQGQLKFYFPRKFWFSVWNSPFITLFSGGTSGKKPASQCRRHLRQGLDTWVGKIPWRRAWKLTPVFLPREFQGQKSLVGYSPWGRKESDKTDWYIRGCCRNYMCLCMFKCWELCPTCKGHSIKLLVWFLVLLLECTHFPIPSCLSFHSMQ